MEKNTSSYNNVDVMAEIYKKDNHIISREAKITADLNIWKMATLLLACALIVMSIVVAMVFSYNKTPQVYWTKLYPNGGWGIDFQDKSTLVNSTKTFDFYKNTVDSLLTNYVKLRYSKNAHTILSDYGKVRLFMGQKVYKQFVSKDEYNAAKVAVDFSDCNSCRNVEIQVRNINHLDEVNKMITRKTDSAIYVTTFYVTEIERSSEGLKLGSKPKIVNIQWRLMSDKERNAKIQSLGNDLQSYLHVNPLFLEIMSSSYEDDIVNN